MVLFHRNLIFKTVPMYTGISFPLKDNVMARNDDKNSREPRELSSHHI